MNTRLLRLSKRFATEHPPGSGRDRKIWREWVVGDTCLYAIFPTRPLPYRELHSAWYFGDDIEPISQATARVILAGIVAEGERCP